MENDKEYANIQRFLILHKKIDQTRNLILVYERNNRDAIEIEQVLSNLEKEMQELKIILSDPKEVTSTESRFRNLIYQLQIIHDKLKLDRFGNNIDRNHRLILENYIYDDILRDIENSLTSMYMGVSIPTYYYTIDSDFDFDPVKELINICITELNQIDESPNNFIELFNLYYNIRERIIDVAIAEYKKNRKPKIDIND